MKLFKRGAIIKSRKPCDDMVDAVKNGLSEKGIPMQAINDGTERYLVRSPESVSKFSAYVELNASAFEITDGDYFFAYTIHFYGNTEIERILQKAVVDSVFNSRERSWERSFDYRWMSGSPCKDKGSYNALYRLNSLNSINPRDVSNNIYDAIMKYTDLRTKTSGLIERLECIQREEKSILERIAKELN
ncbi:MAG: hypothetical protein V1866_01220 [archaeon]